MPHQEGGCPAEAPHNIPPSSTSGTKKASPGDPLRNITNYRSAGWRKDLGHILGSFYKYNYPSHKEEEWNKLKAKFFDYLGQHKEEWKTLKEEKPLQYMPYMEHHFQALTGVRLKGLSQFTGWIKPGSYYHGVVARKGQLHLCLHLAGTALPSGPQICPSQTQALTQKKEETPTTSPHTPGKGGGVTQGTRSDPPIPMETGGAGDGQSWAKQAKASTEEEWRRDRPQSITGHHLGDGKLGLPILSCSRIAREGMRQYSSSTGMQMSAPQPIMMWLPREWPATTLIWSWVWQRASTTRYSA